MGLSINQSQRYSIGRVVRKRTQGTAVGYVSRSKASGQYIIYGSKMLSIEVILLREFVAISFYV